MPGLRRIQGELVFPDDAGAAVAERVVVELRDVSAMDQPSRVLAATELRDQPIGPGTRLPFAFDAPESPPRDALGLRAQVTLRGAGGGAAQVEGTDYLSTGSQPVEPAGDARGLQVPLSRP